MRNLYRTMPLAALAAALVAGSFAAPARAGSADGEVLAEINYARAHPQDYAWRLLLQPVSDWERSLGPDAAAQDPAALAEAIDFLMHQSPLPPQQPDDALGAAALEHVAEQGPVGAVGHESPDGERFDARLRRHGLQPTATSGENIAYGPARPEDVVRELIIDSGVRSRGHRRNIFYPTFAAAGVSCGPHKVYAAMCVIDFASSQREAYGWRQADLTPQAPSPRTGD
jgi:hypothetical protein